MKSSIVQYPVPIVDREKKRAAERRNYARHKEARRAAARARYKLKPKPTEEQRERRREAHKRWYEKSGKLYGAKRQFRDDLKRGATRPRPERCEVCGRRNGKHGIALDHCHETGMFRGWLCYSCNTILGHCDDNPEILRKLINYLTGSEPASH